MDASKSKLKLKSPLGEKRPSKNGCPGRRHWDNASGPITDVQILAMSL